jgi:hypothetical protein
MHLIHVLRWSNLRAENFAILKNAFKIIPNMSTKVERSKRTGAYASGAFGKTYCHDD